MSLSTTMIAVVRKQLEDKGRPVTFERVVEGSYSPSNSGTGAATTTGFSGFGLPEGYNHFEVTGKNIRVSDIKFWFAPPTTAEIPLVGDTATIDSVVHKVINVNKITAQGTNLLYELQLRI